MNDHVNQSPPESHPISLHETTDVNPMAIAGFAVGLSATVIFVLIFMNWMFWRFEVNAKRTDVPQSSTTVEQKFTGPKLQAQPSVELARFRRDEQQRLSSYGWVDRRQGAIRIPVKRAIELLAKRGLPEPKGAMKPTEEQDSKP